MRLLPVVVAISLLGAGLRADEGKEGALRFSKDDEGKVPAGWKAEHTGR